MACDIKADAMWAYNDANIQIPDDIAFCASELEVTCEDFLYSHAAITVCSSKQDVISRKGNESTM